MPVTTVTGNVFPINPEVPEGRQQGSMTFAVVPAGTLRLPMVVTDGSEPPSLLGLNSIARFCFTQIFPARKSLTALGEGEKVR